MSFLKTYQTYIQLLPIFILTFGCGIDASSLITASIILYLILCKIYHEPYISELAKSKVFKISLLAIAIWVISMIIPSIYNGGDFKVIEKYVGRMAPLFLIGIMGKQYTHTLQTIWVGITAAVLWFCVDTALHPNFLDGTSFLNGRLMGSFGWPNGLASVMCLLLPIVIFGVVKYWKDKPFLGFIGLLIYFAGIAVVLFTVSRNAYIVCAVVVVLVIALLFVSRDWLSLKIAGAGILVAVIGLLSFAPPIFYQRINQSLEMDGRMYLMDVSKQIYEEHPVLGIGIGNWGTLYRERFELPDREKNMNSPHNIYLQTVNESGLIGLFGFLIMLGFQVGILFKDGFTYVSGNRHKLRWTGGVFLIIAATIVSGFFDYDFFSRHPMHLYWFYWGIAVFDMYWHVKE